VAQMLDAETQDYEAMLDRLPERIRMMLATLTLEEIRQLVSELEQETGESTE
jgi:hypothetical protein